MAGATGTGVADLAAMLRPSLLRLTRIVRNQRVDTSVTLTSLSAMYTLHNRGPMSAGELASYEKVQPPSMTKVLAGLEERCLVLRSPNPKDKRQAILAITAAGIALLDDERRSRDAWLFRRLDTLDPDERAVLERAVPILDKLAEQ